MIQPADETFPFGDPISFQESLDQFKERQFRARPWDHLPKEAQEMVELVFFAGFSAMFMQAFRAPNNFAGKPLAWTEHLYELGDELDRYAQGNG